MQTTKYWKPVQAITLDNKNPFILLFVLVEFCAPKFKILRAITPAQDG